GWARCRAELVGALAQVKTFVDTGNFMAVQAAAATALDNWASFVPGNVEIFRQRRDAAVEEVRENGLECNKPQATMYLWIRLPEHITSAEFAQFLVEEEGGVVMPGSNFGVSGAGVFRACF